jgi:DNA-binding response OmpR family regulator
MDTGTGGNVSVLVVDDELRVAETYAGHLRTDDTFEPTVAGGGEEAVERMDETVDVVLLDRRMPGFSGDDVLRHIRDVGYDCAVGMVTAVRPDEDVVELPFDMYLVKPVRHEELLQATRTLARIRTYEDSVREEFTLARKCALLSEHLPESELAESEAYARLRERYEEVSDETDEVLDEMDIGDIRRTLGRI